MWKDRVARLRRDKVMWLRRACGATSQEFNGAQAIGVINAHLQEQRMLLNQVVGGTSKTAAITAMLAMGGARHEHIDPATSQIVFAPVFTIAAALWDGYISRTDCARAWQHWRATLAIKGSS